MFKLYKCQNNGEFVILIDAPNTDYLEEEAGKALLAALEVYRGDEDFTINDILPKLFRARDLLCKNLQRVNGGFLENKADITPAENKMIIKCGFEWPNETSTPVYSSGEIL